METKNKRVKFGLFRTEAKALEECNNRKGSYPEGTTSFYARQLVNTKAGKKSWLAYCLIKK